MQIVEGCGEGWALRCRTRLPCPRAGTDQARGHRGGARARPHRGRRRRARDAQERGRGVDEGAVPLPRRAHPLLPRAPPAGLLALLRVRRGRGRHHLRPADQPPGLHRGGGVPGRPHRRPAALRGGRAGAPRRGARHATAPHGRQPPGRGLVRPAAGHPSGPGRPRLPDLPGLRSGSSFNVASPASLVANV